MNTTGDLVDCVNCGYRLPARASRCPICGRGRSPSAARHATSTASVPRPQHLEDVGETSGAAITALVFAVLGYFMLPVVAPLLSSHFTRLAEDDLLGDPNLRGEGLVDAARSLVAVWWWLLVAAFAVVIVAFVVVVVLTGSYA